MKNSYHKAFVPSRRVNYYKHVKSDLRDNITSRDVPKEYGFVCRTARTRCSGNSPQNPVLKTSRNGYLDLRLRRTRKKKRSWYWSMNLTRLSDFLQNPTESKSRRMLSKSLGLSSIKRHMCKISICQWIWMNLTRVLPCEYSHFPSPRRPLRTFCGSSSSNKKKKTPKVENEHPPLKSTWYMCDNWHVNCVCAFVNGLF